MYEQDPKDNYRYKDCNCYSFSENLTPYMSKNSDRIAAGQAFANLSIVTPESYGRTRRKASCQKAGYAAPQHDADGIENVDRAISEWCTQVDGTVVNQGLDIPNTMRRYSFYSYWLSAGLWNNNCGKTSKIDKKDCEETLKDAMSSCDPNSGTTHGASKISGCLQYVSTMD